MITEFSYNNEKHIVSYIESIPVIEGVNCDVYKFNNNSAEKDLAIITIQPGFHTPRQKILHGTKTIEGHISGIGELRIENSVGDQKVYQVSAQTTSKFSIELHVGDIMQWLATSNETLVAFEICYPPYTEGRYLNL